VENSYRQKYLRLRDGGNVRPRRPLYILQDRNIIDATNLLCNNQYTVLEFLHRTSHAVGEAVALHSENSDVEDDSEGENEVAPPPAQPDHLGKK